MDELKSSHSIRGIQTPDFEVLDAKIASALNKIIQNTRFKTKGQSGGNESSQRRQFPPRKTDCLLDLRILPDHWCQRFCEQNILTRHIFSCFTAHISMSHVTLAQDVCPHHVIQCFMRSGCFDPLRLSMLHFSPSLSSSF